MFDDIKRQITLYNTLILIVFLFLFIFLLGFLVQYSFVRTGRTYLYEASESIINDDPSIVNQNGTFDIDIHRQFGFEYIIWNTNNKVETQKITHPGLIMEGYNLLLKEDQEEDSGYEVVEQDDNAYRLYSRTFEENGEILTLQVFQQITAERSVITYVITFLFIIGACGILALIPISNFLAGKSLVSVKKMFDNQKKFIADASHELRTPITVIQTNVEVLKMKEEEPIKDNLKWLNNISLESETMAKLVSELLLIARAESKTIQLDKTRFSVSKLCYDVYNLMEELAKEKEITLTLDAPEGIDYVGDEDKLRQSVRILVDNAIKYTHEGGNVKIGLKDTKRTVNIMIKDNGIGLTEEEKRNVFSRFYRADDARNRQTGGVGLGLNIANAIIDQHNGRIKIESQKGVGSTFTVYLPKSLTGRPPKLPTSDSKK